MCVSMFPLVDEIMGNVGKELDKEESAGVVAVAAAAAAAAVRAADIHAICLGVHRHDDGTRNHH